MAINVGASTVTGHTSNNSTTTAGIATQVAGSIFAVGVVWETDATPPTISDSKLNAYTQIGVVRRVSTAFNAHCGLWYKENGVGGSSHTFTAAKSSGFCAVFAAEITGALTASALDQQNGAADDTATPVTSGDITTTQADELLIGFSGVEGSADVAFTANNSFTKLLEQTSPSFWQGVLGYRIVSATLTTEWSVGVTNLVRGAGLVASFKAAAGGGGAVSVPHALLRRRRWKALQRM